MPLMTPPPSFCGTYGKRKVAPGVAIDVREADVAALTAAGWTSKKKTTKKKKETEDA